MDKPVLTDPEQFPTEEIILTHIGKKKEIWNLFFTYLHFENPDIEENWRYYKDAKSWLMKATRKSKTVFWLSVLDGFFRITCYFTAKADDTVEKSKLSKELKEEFLNGKEFGKIKGITVRMTSKKNLDYAKELISIKLSMK